MVQEIPIDGDTGTEDVQEQEEPASSVANSTRVPQEHPEQPPEPTSSPPEPKPKKRGRPKKIPEPEPPPPPPPAPKPKQRKPKVEKAPPEALVAEPFSLDDMSSAQLVAALVNRRRASEREMKQNLYRSFVM